MRDTIARRSDVDKDSIKYEVEPGNEKYRKGTATFAAKKGQSIDLKGLHADLKGTRLGGGTRSEVIYLEITAAGELTAGDKNTLLKVSGAAQQFVLGDDPKAKPEADKKTAYQRLQEAVKKGEKIVNVTGRVEGWSGRWPDALRELPKYFAEDGKKPQLLVTDFELAKP